MLYSDKFKAELALAALAKPDDLVLLAKQHNVAPDELTQWRDLAVKAVGNSFSNPLRLHATNEVYDPSELLGIIAENLTQGLFMMDAKGYCVYANPAWLEMTGYSAEEIKSRPLHDLVHHHYPDGRPFPLEECPLDRALPENFDVRSHEDLFFRKDGTSFPVLCAATPIFKNGKPVATVIEVRDVTRQKAAEEALRQSEQEFRMLAENMQHFAWIADRHGERLWFNNRWLDFAGTALDEVKGWGWRKLHHPDHVERTERLYRDALKNGLPFETTFPLQGKNGQYRWFLARVVPVHDDSGQVVRWFGTNTDITDLLEAQEALKQANQEKDRYLSVLAHELRNPLAPIRTALDLLNILIPKDADLARATAVIGRQVTHMTHLVDDLLDVARISSGRVMLRKERCNLIEIVFQAAEDYRKDIEENDVDLSLEMPNEPLWIEADRTRIAQVIGNLLHNAGKFTAAKDKIAIRLETEESPAGGVAKLTIEDTGCGIEQELLANIFNPFAQAHQDLGRSKGGLGLGLALAKGLAELHSGSIQAHSDGLGKGAVFTLRIPLGATKKAVQITEVPPPSVERRKIVIIDDNKDLVAMLEMALTVQGHEVRSAYTGSAGIDLVRSFEPDVVLCDIGLPGDVNGYGVVRSLRANPAFSSRLIVAISGYNQESDQELSRKAGFDMHLGKPVSLTELNAVLSSPATIKTVQED